jgi:hypothetical protein
MDDIVREAREAMERSHDYDRDNRREAMEDLRFTAGFQWSDAAKAERAGRPMITINRSSQFLRQVSNPIRMNMPTIKVEPDRDEQSEMAEIANGLLRRIQYNSSASHVYAGATEHMVACGIGWFRVVHDYAGDDSFDQELLVKRVFNPLSVYPDPAALEPDRSDMQWCLVSEMMPLASFKAKYKGKSPTGVDTTSGSGSSVTWNSGDYVRVAEFWKRKPKKATLALLANGSTHLMTERGEQQIRDLVAQGVITNTRDVTTYSTEMVLVSGHDVLSDASECPCQWIPIIPVVGAEIPLDEGVYRHGLIRFQREPQQLHNYFMSVAAESLGQQPKVPYLATVEQIKEYKGLWDNANRSPSPYLLYKPDSRVPGGAPTRVAPPPLPTGLIQMAQMLSDDMKATTGIYDAALGAKSNETSGVAIAARTEQGNQATAHFVDNLEHSLEHLGRVLLDMIPKVYDTQRTLRLIGEDDTEKEVTVNQPLMAYGESEFKHNDLSQMSFKSVRVILGPSYASRRAEAVNALVQLAQSIPQIAAVGPDLIVKNMDFDGADQLAERLRATLPPQIMQIASPEQAQAMQPPPDPMADAQAQGALRMMEAQGAEAEAKAQEAGAKAAKESQGVQFESDRAQAELEGVMLDNLLKRKKLTEPPPQPANRVNAGASGTP